MSLYVFLSLIALCALCGGTAGSRKAMAYYCGVFLFSGLIFRALWSDQQMPFETYLLILSSCSILTVGLYMTLPASRWLIAAALCEVALIAVYLLLALRIDAVISVRLPLMQGLNLAAMAALMGGWLDGLASSRRESGNRWRDAGPDWFTARSGVILGSDAGSQMDSGR